MAKYEDEPEHVETDEEEPASKRSKSVFDIIMQQEPPATRSREARFEAEIDAYLSIRRLPDDADPALYWKDESRFPTIKLLAAKYLPILASSAPVERLFSQAGKIFRPDRCRLTDSNFTRLMNIRSNRKFYVPSLI